MAETSPPASDFKPHVRGYEKFVTVFKWGAIVCFVVAAVVVYLIAY